MAFASAIRRVVIVDDDLWIRSGRAHALAAVEDIEVVASLDHAHAIDGFHWRDVDVALVDAWDHHAGFDRFPGVAVVEAIRRSQPTADTTIIVITGHVLNDMLRLRMAEAGADYFYGHDDVANIEELAAVIREPGRDHRPAEVAPEMRRRLGIGTAGRPNAALAWVRAQRFDEAFSGESQKALPITRRAIMRIRREVGALAHLEPPPATGAEHDVRWPEWQHVVRFVNRVRGAEEPPT